MLPRGTVYVGKLFVTVNEIFRFPSLPYLSVLDKCLDSPLYLLFFSFAVSLLKKDRVIII